MVNLRTRLLVGYGYMAVLLLLTAGSAGFGFFTINEAIERILSEKFRSVSASVSMMEALEDQNEYISTAILHDADIDEELTEADEEFTAAYLIASENVTIAGEEEIVERLNQRFDAYITARDEFLAVPGNGGSVQTFTRNVLPTLISTRRSIFELIEINHDEIIRADAEAQSTAIHMVGLLGILVTLAMISMVFLSRALQQKILVRLRDLNDVAEEILTGNHSRRFDASINDELGVVASQLNAALDERDEIQSEMRGRLNQQKQLVLGLLADEKMILLCGLDGKVIASTCKKLKQKDLRPVQKWLAQKRQASLQEFRDHNTLVELNAQFDGRKYHARLLAALGRRPVGWLVHIDDSERSTKKSADAESAPTEE